MATITNLNKDILAVEGNCSKVDLFRQVARYLCKEAVVSSSERLVQELLNREEVGNTIVEEGIAMPHVESLNVLKSTVLFVQLEKGVVNWQEASEPISLAVFLLLKEDESLAIKNEVIRIVRMFGDDEIVEQIRKCDYSELRKFLEESL